MITVVEMEICHPVVYFPGFGEKNVGIIFNSYTSVFKTAYLFKRLLKMIHFEVISDISKVKEQMISIMYFFLKKDNCKNLNFEK